MKCRIYFHQAHKAMIPEMNLNFKAQPYSLEISGTVLTKAHPHFHAKTVHRWSMTPLREEPVKTKPSVSPPRLKSLITSAHVQTDETTDVPPEE